MTREGLLTDIRNFTNLFFVILRHEFSERLESSIVSDLGMRFAIRSLDLAFHDFILLSPGTLSSVRRDYVFKKRASYLLSSISDSGKRTFYIRDPLFFPFMNSCQRPPL